MTAGGSGTVGGINMWANHILEYGRTHQKKVIVEAIDARRKDFTSFKNNIVKRILFGVYAYSLFCLKIYRLLKNHDYHVIHIVSAGSYGLIRDLVLIYIAKYTKTKCVVHFHFGRIPSIKQNNDWEWKFIKRIVEKSDKIIVLDNKSYDCLAELNTDMVVKVPNPVAPRVLHFIESNSEKKRENNIVLYVGQCYKEKGIFEFVEACGRISNIKCKLIGSISVDVASRLKKIPMQTNTALEIVGKMTLDEVIAEMQKCSVFVLPSYSEGFPNVILEAMACGCPIVATDVGAIPEMLGIENGDKYGLCVKPKDVDALRKAIEKMLSDEEYVKRCGKNAQKRVSELYRINKVWGQLEEIWSTL